MGGGDRRSGGRFRPVGGATALTLVAALAAGGCAEEKRQVDYNLVYADVPPVEYARILCQHIPMQDRHTCMTSVMQHNEDYRDRRLTPAEVANGPFVMFLDDVLYQGRYVSQPFAAAFTVVSETNVCRGRYNAFAGDEQAVFDVRCDDGGFGEANIVLDRRGANGIGEVTLTDGRRGRIVFGHAAVGGEFL